MLRVASVEPSSTTTSSRSPSVCPRMLSTASARNRSPSCTGRTTETSGLATGRGPRLGPELAPPALHLDRLQTGFVELGREAPQVVLHHVRRIAEPRQAELAAQRHVPVAILGGDADEDAARVKLARDPAEEVDPGVEVLDDVREDDGVERTLRQRLEGVLLEKAEALVPEALARERERRALHVDSRHVCSRPHGEIVRELALAGADVEDALARPDALDEEVVVAREPVLGVDPAVVADRAAVDLALEVVVEREEPAEGGGSVGSLRDHVHPGLEDAVGEPWRHASKRGSPDGADQLPTSRSKTSRWRSSHGLTSKRKAC